MKNKKIRKVKVIFNNGYKNAHYIMIYRLGEVLVKGNPTVLQKYLLNRLAKREFIFLKKVKSLYFKINEDEKGFY